MKIDVGIEVEIQEKEGLRTAILGQSGSGKSYLAAKLVEELLDRGFVIAIFDVEGEWWTLSEVYDVLVAGRAAPLDPSVGDVYADVVLQGTSIIFDFSAANMGDQAAREFFHSFAKELFERAEGERSIILVFEEADVFAPQLISKDKRPVAEVASIIARRGRKRGVHSIWITQRPALLSKDVLSQCNVIFLGKMTQRADLQAVKPYVGDLIDQLPSLNTGEFILMQGERVVRFRTGQRKTPHGADTPFSPTEIKRVNDKILAELKVAIENKLKEREQEKSEIERLKAEIKRLNEEIKRRDEEIERLRTAQEAVSIIASALQSKDGEEQIEQLQRTIEKLRAEVNRLREEKAARVIASLPDKHSLLMKSLSNDEAIVYTFVRANQPISKKDAEMLLKGELGYSRFHKAWARLVKLGLLKMEKHGRWIAKEI